MQLGVKETSNPWSLFYDRRRAASLAVAGVLIAAIAATDWYIGLHVSLGALYVVPILILATGLPRQYALTGAVVCAAIRMVFGPERLWLDASLSFAMALIAYTAAALCVSELIRNRTLVLQHLNEMARQQALRQEAEEQLRLLVESSPAAILTVDGAGQVLAANRAAHELLAFEGDKSLIGQPIGSYLPVLTDALKLESGWKGFRTAAQCRGKRRNGELFIAHTWFSTYASAGGRRLAAIAVDSSEEMRDREEENMRHLLHSNRVLAGAVSHDIRNLCGAISVVYSNLKRVNTFASYEDFSALGNLVEGLGKIASMELRSHLRQGLTGIDLNGLLDQLRIIIEPAWAEMEASVRWQIPESIPSVLAEPAGLLQAFLNLAHNSRRAVMNSDRRILSIAANLDAGRVLVAFQDSGPGVTAPEHLFQPFQSGSNSAGIGLYVSRAVLRTFGGDLRHVPQADGCCFVVQLRAAEVK
jgi:PAS domain S-box-containing protein